MSRILPWVAGAALIALRQRELGMIEGAARYYQQRIRRYRAEPGLRGGALRPE